MTDIMNLFDDPFLKAANLEGKDRVAIIEKVTQEEVGQDKDTCPVLHFKDKVAPSLTRNKGLVLNKTNAKRIVKMYGNDVEQWVGKSVTLYEDETTYKGDDVPCIRVRKEQPTGKQ